MIFKSHKDIEELHWNTNLWRYMGIDKFIDILLNKRVWFSNAKNLSDKYEVSFPLKNIRSKEKVFGRDKNKKNEVNRKLMEFEKDKMELKNKTLVNCWSGGTSESYALWKIYLGGARSGVAIKSKVRRLSIALEEISDNLNREIYISKVRYKDFIEESSSDQIIISTKREFYEYEKEIRLFIFDENEKDGMYLYLNIDKLIEKIYISPFCGKWFENSIKSLVNKLAPNLSNRITSSAIDDEF